MGFRRVEEGHDVIVLLEDRLNDSTLDTLTATVNQTNLGQASLARGADVFVDDGRDVTWMEGMQVERALDRNAHNP